MRQFFGMSQSGNLNEAVSGLTNPQLILLMSNSSQFEAHVKRLEELYPRVPSIGCIGMSYDTKVVEKGVGVIAFCDGVTAAANVLEEVSVMPLLPVPAAFLEYFLQLLVKLFPVPHIPAH